MEYILDADQMKSSDTYTIEQLGIASRVLMERASMKCVDALLNTDWNMSHVVVVCGSGNNGGDGFAIARFLVDRGFEVTVLFLGNISHRTEETVYQMGRFSSVGRITDDITVISAATVIIDAIFGIGLNREISGVYQGVITRINASHAKVLAVDIPSGINASNGHILGCAVHADLTVTMQSPKIGLIEYPGCECVGELQVAEIGVSTDREIFERQVCYSLDKKDLRSMIPVRKEHSHKGTFGKVLIIAGSKGMAGAAYLSAHAALISGAGLVQIYTPEENRTILQTLIPEAIVSTYSECKDSDIQDKIEWADVVAVGPGLGKSILSEQILASVFKHMNKPCLIDADGINLLSAHPDWLDRLKELPVILTPHMMEFSRLTGFTMRDLVNHKKELLMSYTNTHFATIVLKDSRSYVAEPNNHCYINKTGNHCLAKGGSGDVLTGIIAALMAQGMTSYQAATAGVMIHGMAGDLAKADLGGYSVLARDTIQYTGKVFRSLEHERSL